MTAKECTFQILDEFPDGRRFKGHVLMDEVLKRTGELHYPDTILRYARIYRRIRGRNIVNVDKAHSIYEVQGQLKIVTGN
jgi:hypothetical protein